jgi:xylose isomerase
MYETIKAGGFTNGGLNFDAKTRRMSYTPEDIVYSFITGMDTFALGLRKAAAIIEDGRIDRFVGERYASYNSGIGAEIVAGKADFVSLEKYALEHEPAAPASGRQEMLEGLVNRILFS